MAQLLNLCPDASIGWTLVEARRTLQRRAHSPAHDPDHTDEPVAVGRRLGRSIGMKSSTAPTPSSVMNRAMSRPPRPLRQTDISTDEATLAPQGPEPNQAIVIDSSSTWRSSGSPDPWPAMLIYRPGGRRPV